MYEEVFGDQQYLLLTWIEQGGAGLEREWPLLGEFRQDAPGFRPASGLDTDNYMGLLPQQNTPTESFADFYRDSRLMPLYKTGCRTWSDAMQVPLSDKSVYRDWKNPIPAENPPSYMAISLVRPVLFDAQGTLRCS